MSGKGENLNSLQLLNSSDTLDRKVTCKPTSFASDQDSDSLEKGKVSSLVKHKSKEGSTRSAGQVDNKKGCGEEDRVRKRKTTEQKRKRKKKRRKRFDLIFKARGLFYLHCGF
ncbi:hypothetical protein Q3G72_008498 [Acer saccharum]|nr:hypothetical protein Q3G72_008498 [Acer saccharum]